MVTSDVCTVFSSAWVPLSHPHNCKAGSDNFGENFTSEHAIDCPGINSAACFFTGVEFMAMLCSNTSENSRMNSTKMAINKATAEREEEERLRKELQAKRSRGKDRAFGRGNTGGSQDQEADAMGIRNVRTVGEKAVQMLEFRVTAFLGNIDMMRVRSMLLLLEEISAVDSKLDKEAGEAPVPRSGADEGAIAVSLSSLLQGVLHNTNTVGVTSNGGAPEARRIQGVPVCSMIENQQNLETIFRLFDINVPSSA